MLEVLLISIQFAGLHPHSTIGPDLRHQLIKHPMTDIGVKQFELDAEGLYDIEF